MEVELVEIARRVVHMLMPGQLFSGHGDHILREIQASDLCVGITFEQTLRHCSGPASQINDAHRRGTFERNGYYQRLNHVQVVGYQREDDAIEFPRLFFKMLFDCFHGAKQSPFVTAYSPRCRFYLPNPF